MRSWIFQLFVVAPFLSVLAQEENDGHDLRSSFTGLPKINYYPHAVCILLVGEGQSYLHIKDPF